MTLSQVGIIGNCTIGALVDKRGRYVWGSFGHLSGDPVFNSLLNIDSGETGFSDVVLQDFCNAEQDYVPSTAILQTTLRSTNGAVVQIEDFCPLFINFDRLFRPFQLVRVIKRIEGEPFITIRMRPTFNYNSSDGYIK